MLCVALPGLAQEVEVFDKAANSSVENWSTGPKTGESIPDFQTTDQNSMPRSLDDSKGPKHLYSFFSLR